MKVKVKKNGSITLTAEKPGELTKWFREVAEAVQESDKTKSKKEQHNEKD